MAVGDPEEGVDHLADQLVELPVAARETLAVPADLAVGVLVEAQVAYDPVYATVAEEAGASSCHLAARISLHEPA